MPFNNGESAAASTTKKNQQTIKENGRRERGLVSSPGRNLSRGDLLTTIYTLMPLPPPLPPLPPPLPPPPQTAAPAHPPAIQH